MSASTVEVVDPESPEAARALAAYATELSETFGVTLHPMTDLDDLRPPRGTFVLLWHDAAVAGCGGLRLLDEDTGEVKRMWLDPSVRGRGLARALLGALEERAADLGCTRVVLDTSDRLEAAVATYHSCGYREVAPYNDNPEARLWFEKALRI